MYDESKFRQFVAAYPSHRRVATSTAKRAFALALRRVPYAVLLHALEQHKRSEQWHKHIVPSLVTWLEEERWIQTLPEPTRSKADEARRLSRLTPYEHARRLGLK